MKQESILEAFATVAIRMDADEMEVEYDEGHYQIYAFKGGTGVGIGRTPIGTPEAARLRAELRAIGRRKRVIVVDGLGVELRATKYDSFGETAFRVELRRV